jgi:uncharacterized membrane protein YfcA
MLLVLIIFLLGLFAATIGSLVGLGGGVFIVPGLLFFRSHFEQIAHITPQVAVGTSLLVIIFTASSSTLFYAKQKKVDFRSGWFFFMASGPGAILGSFLNTGLNEKTFNLLFGLILIIILYFLFKNKRMKAKNIRWHVTRQCIDERGQPYEYGYHRYLALIICFGVGIIQGLLGIGGGTLLVPAMILLFWYPAHVAIATSMFVILLSSLAGSISHIFLGNVDWFLLLWLAPGALLGGHVGAMISDRINGERLTILLRGIIIFLAVHALWEGLVINFYPSLFGK